ncbi:ABC transporter ATP-binding protein [Paenibacillus puerhi]|uniref:ABC transporter ATP-binding protein n=1 Tax=Paenibacillus puerhi TaxID=2692622 RepID=UPI0013587C73|nr:ABC transporter ATP-binding protein [Paenibacillus puerhi]
MTETKRDKGPIIDIKEVTFRYPGAAYDSLSQVSLTLERGDFTAIIGSNGSGKSTLCKCLNGLIPTYYAGDMEGSVAINGLPTSQTSIAELSKHVAYVFQDFENQLVRPTVLDEVCFAPLNFGYEDYQERGKKALQMLEMEDLQGKWIWQLSGGQKHMTALAAALSLDPDIIIIDEPVAQLDPAHARMIYEKLTLLNQKYNKTIIVIEHHTEYIADFCHKVVLMEAGGRVRWVKDVREGLSAVEELASLHIQPPQVTQAFHELRGHLFESKKPGVYPVTIQEAAHALHLASLPDYRKHEIDLGAEKTNTAKGKRLVHFDGVFSGYPSMDRKQRPTLQNINLHIHEGERIALIGNNGAGKSTLLRLIAGIRRPWQGTVTVCDTDTKQTSPEKLSEHVSFIVQNPEEMFIADNIRSDIEFFLKARKREPIGPFVDRIVQTFKLQNLQQRDGRLLSGRQQRRATLAIGMAMRPAVMLLDEPTVSLDIASRREMTQLFDELRDHVKAIVVATHDMQLVADWATRVIVM